MRRLLALCLVVGACGHAPKSDWELEHEEDLAKIPAEEAVVLPAYPKARELIEFSVSPRSEFRFFVDPASISVAGDGIVRYTLVARSPSGAQNVSYEGMRCRTAELRVYALGRGGSWTLRFGAWRALQAHSVQPWHNALFREHFCPLRRPIANRDEGIHSLRRDGRVLQQN